MITESGDVVPAESLANGEQEGRPPETKAQRFRRLAERRTARCLKDMAALIPLTSRAQYEYSEQEADQICGALSDALMDVKRAFAGVRRQATAFTLK